MPPGVQQVGNYGGDMTKARKSPGSCDTCGDIIEPGQDYDRPMRYATERERDRNLRTGKPYILRGQTPALKHADCPHPAEGKAARHGNL